MITKISDFVKTKFYDTVLIIIVALLVLLSFAFGFITAKYQQKQPIQIEKIKTTLWNKYRNT
ncbi:MAG: hypothetical protein HYT35_01480 [Candidatus Staskawiczbacteria bacterium]|nr:hypothetical protein [Candidatus Staskawiczbacteria bacterium]